MTAALDYECPVQIQQDIPQAIQLLGEMNSNVKQVTDLVESMLQRVKRGEVTTEYGLSFLEIKYHMLLDYLINLTYVVLRKCSGETIDGDPSIERLIEIRTVLEKIRPIDHKLRHQIDRLVRTAKTGIVSSNDPSIYKPNLDNMLTNDVDEDEDDEDGSAASEREDDEDDDDDDEDTDEAADGIEGAATSVAKKSKKASKSGIYVPPRIKPVYYDGDEHKNVEEKKQKLLKIALTQSQIKDMQDEFLDTPIVQSTKTLAEKQISLAQQRKTEFEETYMTRLPETKAEKHRRRQLTTLGTLGTDILNDIGHYRDGASGNKKRKLKSKGKKHAGGKKRKLH